jgi:hypothetical protein
VIILSLQAAAEVEIHSQAQAAEVERVVLEVSAVKL